MDKRLLCFIALWLYAATPTVILAYKGMPEHFKYKELRAACMYIFWPIVHNEYIKYAIKEE